MNQVFPKTVEGVLWLDLQKDHWESRSEAAEEWVAALIGTRPYILDDRGKVEWARRFAERSGLAFGLYQAGPTPRGIWPFRDPPEQRVLLGCTNVQTLEDCADGFCEAWSGGMTLHLFESETNMRLQLQEWNGQTFHNSPTAGSMLYSIRIGFDGEQIGLLPNRHDLAALRELAKRAAEVLGYEWVESAAS